MFVELVLDLAKKRTKKGHEYEKIVKINGWERKMANICCLPFSISIYKNNSNKNE